MIVIHKSWPPMSMVQGSVLLAMEGLCARVPVEAYRWTPMEWDRSHHHDEPTLSVWKWDAGSTAWLAWPMRTEELQRQSFEWNWREEKWWTDGKENEENAYRYSVQGDSVSPNQTERPGAKFSPCNSIVAASPPPSTYRGKDQLSMLMIRSAGLDSPQCFVRQEQV